MSTHGLCSLTLCYTLHYSTCSRARRNAEALATLDLLPNPLVSDAAVAAVYAARPSLVNYRGNTYPFV